jgi:hypothetical protein
VRLAALAIVLTAVACGGAAPAGFGTTGGRAPNDAARPRRGVGAMPDVQPSASTMTDALKAAGLDPANLPPLETLDKEQRLRVMKTFTAALGVGCMDCHASGDFVADTRRKRVAKRMFNEITRVLALETGEPVYCDSCHQGTLFTLDRRDKSKIGDYMSDVLVGKMKRVDGRDHDCGTCHGDPPDFAFLTAWKNAPAPDLTRRPVPLVVAVAPMPPAAPEAPSPETAPPPKPRPASAPLPEVRPQAGRQPEGPMKDCGDKTNLCPLQAWMRKNVATAVAGGDTAALAKALDRVAGMAPDPSWTAWGEMSKAAAAAARGGDMTEARKSCQGCHNAFKAKWRESYRTRVVK